MVSLFCLASEWQYVRLSDVSLGAPKLYSLVADEEFNKQNYQTDKFDLTLAI